MLCEISIVANDNESDFVQARGAVTSTKAPTTSVTQSQRYSPSRVNGGGAVPPPQQ